MFCLILIAPVLLCVAYHSLVAIRISLLLRGIRAAGQPISLEELNAWYPESADGPNAAEPFRAAFVRLADALEERDEAFPVLIKREFLQEKRLPDAEQIQQARKYLEADREALDALHRGASMPVCRYNTDWQRDAHPEEEAVLLGTARTGTHDLMFLCKGVGDAVRLLCLEAVTLAAETRPEAAVDALHCGVRVLRSLENVPMLMSHLVAANLGNQILDTAEYLRDIRKGDTEFHAQLQAAIAPLNDSQRLARIFIGERCFGLDAPKGAYRNRLPGHWPPAAIPLLIAYDLAGFNRADRLAYLRRMNAHIAAAQAPVPERRTRLEAVDAACRARPAWRRLFDSGAFDGAQYCKRDTELLCRVEAF